MLAVTCKLCRVRINSASCLARACHDTAAERLSSVTPRSPTNLRLPLCAQFCHLKTASKDSRECSIGGNVVVGGSVCRLVVVCVESRDLLGLSLERHIAVLTQFVRSTSGISQLVKRLLSGHRPKGIQICLTACDRRHLVGQVAAARLELLPVLVGGLDTCAPVSTCSNGMAIGSSPKKGVARACHLQRQVGVGTVPQQAVHVEITFLREFASLF